VNSAELEHLLTFAIAGKSLAIPLGSVEEVVGCGRITRVPWMPPFVRGAMNLRGRALPVIDLAAKLGFAETVVTRWACLLLVRVPIHGEPTLLGVLVDAVTRLYDVRREQIQLAPSVGTGIHRDYVSGLLHADGKLVLVLDIARIFSTEQLMQLSRPALLTDDSAAEP
jgi:purine-binding chemotaxis protein CheW